ncbi:MAG: polymer-forming cytoskeletal protein [Chitinophagaceae bacterium]
MICAAPFFANAQNTFPGSGNVGIGTVAPNSNLQIDNVQNVFFGPTGTTTPAFTIYNNLNLTSPPTWPYGYDPNIVEVWQTQVPNPDKLPVFIIKTSNASVGIGTDVPVARLDVNGDIHSSGTVTADANVSAGGNLAVGGNGQIGGNLRVGPRQAINSYANYALSVDGDIICKRAVVQIGDWADDVFDVDYKPMPLAALSSFITANHHLPNVPTTAEVTKNGADVGAMNVILLRKVEELTLYVLELKKENEEMQKSLKALKN